MNSSSSPQRSTKIGSFSLRFQVTRVSTRGAPSETRGIESNPNIPSSGYFQSISPSRKNERTAAELRTLAMIRRFSAMLSKCSVVNVMKREAVLLRPKLRTGMNRLSSGWPYTRRLKPITPPLFLVAGCKLDAFDIFDIFDHAAATGTVWGYWALGWRLKDHVHQIDQMIPEIKLFSWTIFLLSSLMPLGIDMKNFKIKFKLHNGLAIEKMIQTVARSP